MGDDQKRVHSYSQIVILIKIINVDYERCFGTFPELIWILLTNQSMDREISAFLMSHRSRGSDEISRSSGRLPESRRE